METDLCDAGCEEDLCSATETFNSGGSKDSGLDIGGFFVIDGVLLVVIHHQYQRDKEGGRWAECPACETGRGRIQET